MNKLFIFIYLFIIIINCKSEVKDCKVCNSNLYFQSKLYLHKPNTLPVDTNLAKILYCYEDGGASCFIDELIDDPFKSEFEYLFGIALFIGATVVVGLFAIISCICSCPCICCCNPKERKNGKKCVIASRIFLMSFALTSLGFGIAGAVYGFQGFQPSTFSGAVNNLLDTMMSLVSTVTSGISGGVITLGNDMVYGMVEVILGGIVEDGSITGVFTATGDLIEKVKGFKPEVLTEKFNEFDVLIEKIPKSEELEKLSTTISDITNFQDISKANEINTIKDKYPGTNPINLKSPEVVSDIATVEFGYCLSSISLLKDKYNDEIIKKLDNYVKLCGTDECITSFRNEVLSEVHKFNKISYPCPSPATNSINTLQQTTSHTIKTNVWTDIKGLIELDEGINILKSTVNDLSAISKDAILGMIEKAEKMMDDIKEIDFNEITQVIPDKIAIDGLKSSVISLDNNLKTFMENCVKIDALDGQLDSISGPLESIGNDIGALKVKLEGMRTEIETAIGNIEFGKIKEKFGEFNMDEFTALSPMVNLLVEINEIIKTTKKTKIFSKGFTFDIPSILMSYNINPYKNDLKTNKDKLYNNLVELYDFMSKGLDGNNKRCSKTETGCKMEYIGYGKLQGTGEKCLDFSNSKCIGLPRISKADYSNFNTARDSFYSMGTNEAKQAATTLFEIFTGYTDNIINTKALEDIMASINPTRPNYYITNTRENEEVPLFMGGAQSLSLGASIHMELFKSLKTILTELVGALDSLSSINSEEIDAAKGAVEQMKSSIEGSGIDQFGQIREITDILDKVNNPVQFLKIDELEPEGSLMRSLGKKISTLDSTKSWIDHLTGLLTEEKYGDIIKPLKNLKNKDKLGEVIDEMEGALNAMLATLFDLDNGEVKTTFLSDLVSKNDMVESLINIVDNSNSFEDIIPSLSGLSMLDSLNIVERYDEGSIYYDKNGVTRADDKMCLYQQCITNSIDRVFNNIDLSEFGGPSVNVSYVNYVYIGLSCIPLLISLIILLSYSCMSFASTTKTITCCHCCNCCLFGCPGAFLYFLSGILMTVYFLLSDAISSIGPLAIILLGSDKSFGYGTKTTTVSEVINNVVSGCKITGDTDPVKVLGGYLSQYLTDIVEPIISGGEGEDGGIFSSITGMLAEDLGKTLDKYFEEELPGQLGNVMSSVTTPLDCVTLNNVYSGITYSLCQLFVLLFFLSSLWWIFTIFYTTCPLYICAKKALYKNVVVEVEKPPQDDYYPPQDPMVLEVAEVPAIIVPSQPMYTPPPQPLAPIIIQSPDNVIIQPVPQPIYQPVVEQPYYPQPMPMPRPNPPVQFVPPQIQQNFRPTFQPNPSKKELTFNRPSFSPKGPILSRPPPMVENTHYN